MGVVTLSIRTIESRQFNTPPITQLPMTVEVYKTRQSHRPPLTGGNIEFVAGFDPSKPVKGAVDFNVDTLAAAFIIKVKAFSVKNPGKVIWKGFYTAYDGWGTVFKSNTSYLIELWYSWEKDSWEVTAAANIIADDQVLAIGANSGGPGADLPWPGTGKPWWENFPAVKLPTIPKLLPDLGDIAIWIIVGLAVLVIIILVVMKG